MKTAVIYLRVSTAQQAERDADPEGYSIPAQREACRRKAEALGATVVAEYVDRGESAKTADRPALRELLERLRTGRDIDYVVVHKVDRLARSRSDDVTIGLALKAAGAQLVSVTENIDDTPSGKLLHGIMAAIAEFYSQNLATEILKGSVQKAKAGGTPHLAPIGYLNVKQVIDGREVRTIALDPVRAPLVRFAFEAYASGVLFWRCPGCLALVAPDEAKVEQGAERWLQSGVGDLLDVDLESGEERLVPVALELGVGLPVGLGAVAYEVEGLVEGFGDIVAGGLELQEVVAGSDELNGQLVLLLASHVVGYRAARHLLGPDLALVLDAVDASLDLAGQPGGLALLQLQFGQELAAHLLHGGL